MEGWPDCCLPLISCFPFWNTLCLIKALSHDITPSPNTSLNKLNISITDFFKWQRNLLQIIVLNRLSFLFIGDSKLNTIIHFSAVRRHVKNYNLNSVAIMTTINPPPQINVITFWYPSVLSAFSPILISNSIILN